MISFPPRRILVPFDFSGPAAAALRTARSMSERFGSALDVFYVEGSPLAPAQRRSILKKLAAAAGPKARLHTAQGDCARAIVLHARYCQADLIVMGTQGRVGLRRLREGSVTEAVVRDSSIPVLSLHEPMGSVSAVLAPMNLEPYAQSGLLAAAQAAVELGATLTALHVEFSRDEGAATRARESLEAMIEALPEPLRSKARARVRVEGGEPVATILESAPAYGLIVLVARRKSVIGDAVLGTTAERVLRLSPTAVLTVPCPQESDSEAADEAAGRTSLFPYY